MFLFANAYYDSSASERVSAPNSACGTCSEVKSAAYDGAATFRMRDASA